MTPGLVALLEEEALAASRVRHEAGLEMAALLDAIERAGDERRALLSPGTGFPSTAVLDGLDQKVARLRSRLAEVQLGVGRSSDLEARAVGRLAVARRILASNITEERRLRRARASADLLSRYLSNEDIQDRIIEL